MTAGAPRFSAARSLKLGTFHVGSSMADIVTTGIWNRILVTDLGTAAWPVGLLAATRYLMAPLSLWAGHRSDTRPILGSRRVAYIWLGRLLMLTALPLLPLSVVAIADGQRSATGWALATVSALLYGAGTLISGPPFLALVHDSAPYERRGQAVALVQFVLVVSFAFVPALYARLMPTYDPAQFAQLVWLSVLGAAAFWGLSVLGEERRATGDRPLGADALGAGVAPGVGGSSASESAVDAFRALWADARARRYAVFLGASAFFAFMQDAVLEPFGGDVFGLSVGDTTRFNAYWGVGALVAMVFAYGLTRRKTPDEQVGTTSAGLLVLGGSLLGLGWASASSSLPAVRPLLLLFGIGFGVFTVGGVSLLMAMSRAERAGSYLALWSVIQLAARGMGIAAGGAMRDAGLALSSEHSVAYAAVFVVEGLGLLACIWLLTRVGISGFAADRVGGRPVAVD